MTKRLFVIHPMASPGRHAQCGATLIVGLIMLVLITLMVLSAFSLSSSNLKSVGNMQAREEALAAANQVIEQMISSNANFKLAPGATFGTSTVDINNDGTSDFQVQPVLTCIRAIKASNASPSDIEMSPTLSLSANWNTEWDIGTAVTDISSGSGASVEIHQGVKVRLTQAEKDIACP